MKEFVELLDKFRTSRYDAGPKMRIFAAEEMSFAAIIAALGGEKNYQICGEDKPMGWPKNGAMVIGELHTEIRTSDKYFKVIENNMKFLIDTKIKLTNHKKYHYLTFLKYISMMNYEYLNLYATYL